MIIDDESLNMPFWIPFLERKQKRKLMPFWISYVAPLAGAYQRTWQIDTQIPQRDMKADLGESSEVAREEVT